MLAPWWSNKSQAPFQLSTLQGRGHSAESPQQGTSHCCVFWQAVAELRARPEAWWGVALQPLITQTREYHIIHKLHTFPVRLCAQLRRMHAGRRI